MYEHKTSQISFILPFSGELSPHNRWVQLAHLIPWDEVEKKYQEHFPSKKGAPAKPARMALGALIIKEMLQTSDEDTVELIAETPAMQYFLGLDEFVQEAPFDSSSMVHFRKRFGADFVDEIKKGRDKLKEQESTLKDDDQDKPEPPDSGSKPDEKTKVQSDAEIPETEKTPKKGTLILDATCAPADIHFPTDLGILNKAREKSEEIIDELFSQSSKKTKPRTYRQVARKRYLNLAKKKKLSKKVIRKGIGQQLRYLRRNLKHIERLNKEVSLTILTRIQYKNLLVIHEVYRQQSILHKTKSHSIQGRIVSISQPHVRPIVRGKARANTEFGAKISASVCGSGFVSLDRLDWEAYNESSDLKEQAEKYRAQTGYYPEAILADKIYRNTENRKWCKESGIRLSGPNLGRPPKSEELKKEQRLQNRKDESQRNAIEGKFGQAKRRFGLARIMAKLQNTSESMIAISFLVMNLEKLRELFFFIFFLVFNLLRNSQEKIKAGILRSRVRKFGNDSGVPFLWDATKC